MTALLLHGLALGLLAGASPSPHSLMAALVYRQSGRNSSVRFLCGGAAADTLFAFALTPLATLGLWAIPHWLLLLLALTQALALLGGWRWRTKVVDQPRSWWRRGLLLQFCNPNPWLFWLSHGVLLCRQPDFVIFASAFLLALCITKGLTVFAFQNLLARLGFLRIALPVAQIGLLLAQLR